MGRRLVQGTRRQESYEFFKWFNFQLLHFRFKYFVNYNTFAALVECYVDSKLYLFTIYNLEHNTQKYTLSQLKLFKIIE